MTDENLLLRFVEAFHLLNEIVDSSLLHQMPLSPELDAGFDDSDWARKLWQPAKIVTNPNALISVYTKIPERFPPLYEQLLLSFRWLEVDLDGFVTLTANPVGTDLSELVSKITADPILIRVLFPLGLIPFGKASGGSYDQICFDAKRRRPDGDCPVVRIEHESVLCNQKVGHSDEVFRSFRELVEAVVAKAASFNQRRHHHQPD